MIHQPIQGAIPRQMTRVGYPMQVAGFNPKILASLYETPVFLHCAGDGDTPTIGPALTTTGVITEGSPIVLASGGALRSENYTTGRRVTVSEVRPGLTEDLVVAICGREPTTVTANRCWLGTRNAGQRGLTWNTNVTTGEILATLVGDSAVGSGVLPRSSGSAALMLLVAKRGGTLKIRKTPSSSSAGAAVPAGEWGQGTGLCLGDYPVGGLPLASDEAYVAIWHGPGIADLWDAERIAQLYALAGVA